MTDSSQGKSHATKLSALLSNLSTDSEASEDLGGDLSGLGLTVVYQCTNNKRFPPNKEKYK
jgi:hypothetical protein